MRGQAEQHSSAQSAQLRRMNLNRTSLRQWMPEQVSWLDSKRKSGLTNLNSEALGRRRPTRVRSESPQAVGGQMSVHCAAGPVQEAARRRGVRSEVQATRRIFW